jgi:hypothetical protein
MKRKRRAGGKTSAALMRRGGRSSAGRNFQFRADVQFNFIPVEEHEMTDLMIGNPAQLCPIAKRPD